MTNTQFEQPIVSIDVVPIAFRSNSRGGERSPQVLLGRRLFEPFRGELALPGVMILGGETLEEAAYRALKSKTYVGEQDVLKLVKLGAFDTTNRDPRGPTIAITFIALLNPGFDPGELSADWVSYDSWSFGEGLPFDHDKIVAEAFREVGFRLWSDEALTHALLGERFSTREALSLTQRLLGVENVDTANFTRSLKGHSYLREAGKTKGGVGRPSILWEFADSAAGV